MGTMGRPRIMTNEPESKLGTRRRMQYCPGFSLDARELGFWGWSFDRFSTAK
jgi:hypothetical protein